MSGALDAAADLSAERFVPETMGGDLIDAEHQARYRLALPHVRGKRVLDAGCGVGWGTELLLEAGARDVVGLDIADEAAREFRARVPQAPFVLGDLAALPFADASFDVIVCFEALEHTAATGAALDSLARILRPDGVLFVSSPNPAVYPAGNPFHLHELTPAELAAEVGARLPNLTMLHQHLLVGSLICTDADAAAMPGELAVAVRGIASLGPGHDPYSVAVAGGGVPSELTGVQTVVTAHQLTNLAVLTAAVTEERAELHGGYDRIVAEREQLHEALAERAKQAEQLTGIVENTHAALRNAGAALRDVMAERDDALAQLLTAQRELALVREAAQQAGRERATAEPAPADPMQDCEDCARLRADRDEFAAALVRAEQDLAIVTARADDAMLAGGSPPAPRRARSRVDSPEPRR
jgi:hypothetical protein